jgi:Predicted membrane protein
MTLMIVGEICNFVAYAFVDAILVTPLGALSVVITTILSAIFLKERLSFVGKVGCFSCIIGSVVIAMNAPTQSSVSDIQEMQKFVISPGFLTYGGIILVGSAITAIWVAPRYGKKSMFVYISICSMVGGLSVVATQGLGSAILAQIDGEEQFKHWFLYVLFVFVICTLLTEIIYLNVSSFESGVCLGCADVHVLAESAEYFQCCARHSDLLCHVYQLHYRCFGCLVPGFQGYRD